MDFHLSPSARDRSPPAAPRPEQISSDLESPMERVLTRGLQLNQVKSGHQSLCAALSTAQRPMKYDLPTVTRTFLVHLG